MANKTSQRIVQSSSTRTSSRIGTGVYFAANFKEMNKKKLLGWGFWLLGVLVPMHAGLMHTEGVDNVTFLLSFIGFVVCMFTGYLFYDSGSSKLTEDGH